MKGFIFPGVLMILVIVLSIVPGCGDDGDNNESNDDSFGYTCEEYCKIFVECYTSEDLSGYHPTMEGCIEGECPDLHGINWICAAMFDGDCEAFELCES